MKAIGTILGAILGPTLLVALVAAVYPRGTSGSLDPVTPVLTIFFGAIACVAGAIAGSLIADALHRADGQRAARVAGVTMVLIALFPAWLAWVLYGPRSAPKPSNASQRQRWAQEKLAFYAKFGFSEQPGHLLASQVRDCQRGGGGCGSIEWLRYAGDEVAFAAHLGTYRIEDGGWRWDDGWRPSDPEAPRGRTIVFLDPRLKRDGPVFEVQGDDIFRRAARDAPAYSTDMTLAILLAMPECIAMFARSARADGIWDGRPETLPDVMVEAWKPTDTCPGVALQRNDQPKPPGRFEIQSGQAVHARFEISPDATSVDTPFRFAFVRGGRAFMREAGGRWHMRSGYTAGAGDPPPPRCLFDLTVPCE